MEDSGVAGVESSGYLTAVEDNILVNYQTVNYEGYNFLEMKPLIGLVVLESPFRVKILPQVLGMLGFVEIRFEAMEWAAG